MFGLYMFFFLRKFVSVITSNELNQYAEEEGELSILVVGVDDL